MDYAGELQMYGLGELLSALQARAVQRCTNG
jgi:hypothetical protein